jgi:hypothetical protein
MDFLESIQDDWKRWTFRRKEINFGCIIATSVRVVSDLKKTVRLKISSNFIKFLFYASEIIPIHGFYKLFTISNQVLFQLPNCSLCNTDLTHSQTKRKNKTEEKWNKKKTDKNKFLKWNMRKGNYYST